MPASPNRPAVSIIIPTCGRPTFLARALGAVKRQTFTDWEIIVVDDSPTDTDRRATEAVVRKSGIVHLAYRQHSTNVGPGAALNEGIAAARGRYVAFLPDDDTIDPDHLATCVTLLAAQPSLTGAFGGVRWHDDTTLNVRSPRGAALLRTDLPVDDLGRCLVDPVDGRADWPLASGNFLALVQVVLRRRAAAGVRFAERSAVVTDALEYDYWRALLRAGATLGHTGRISCTWTDHPTQHHKIISGRGIATRDWRHQSYGINVYRQRYGIAAGTGLNWQPAHGGLPVDEADRHRPAVASVRPSPTGQRIVIAGSLGFQPDRVLALTSAGHELYGTWLPDAPFWDAAGPLPFTGVTDIPFDVDWSTRMTELAPTVVWAQFNWLAVPFLYRVFRRSRALGIPFVLHFKESPQLAVRAGYWPRLAEMMLAADGRILASAAERDWFAAALDTTLPADTTLVFDGEYPSRAVQTDSWQPRLSDLDDRLHTVSVGRPMLDSVGELDAAGIDVHVYALPYMRAGAGWVKGAPNVHIHEPVRPADWVREFSRYDAGWGHIAASANNGDVGVAAWTDLNLPARLATYAAAGLPWIQRRNTGHRVASRELADDLGVGLHYDDVAHLALLLKQERATRAAAVAMRAHRHLFCFDEHVATLTEFFARCAGGRQP